MSTIRPANLTQASPIPRPVDAARAAAQRAFFEAALGKAPTAAATAATTVPTAAATPAPLRAAPVQRIPDPAAPQPTRILRPGSVLDIRV